LILSIKIIRDKEVTMKRVRVFVIMISVLLLFSAGQLSAAEWANPDLLLDANAVAKIATKPDWVIVDCRALKDYAAGHIPGAISFGDRCKKALRDSTSRLRQDLSFYENLFSKAGIGNNSHVVFYSDQKTKSAEDATVAFWIMEVLGHDKAHVLNGGTEAWRNAGNRLDNKPVKRAPSSFKAKPVYARLATTDEILKIAKGKEKGVQLIDSRTKKEHEGSDIRALRGGYVPNTTMNVDHKSTEEQVKDPKTEKMNPNGFIDKDAVYKAFGSLDKNKRTIAYCQTGTRSTMTYLELRLMGFQNPANWDESWTVWGNSLADYPVANEQYMNFARIKKLEDKIKKIEAKLKEEKK